MCSVPYVANALDYVLKEVASRLERTSGFVQRTSKMTGSLFVQTLVFTWLSAPHASLEQMSQMAGVLGVCMSAQGMEERFSERSAHFLRLVLEEALRTLVTVDTPTLPLLSRFQGVYLFDSTVISLPDALGRVWQGCGGRVVEGSASALKVQVVFNLLDGGLTGVLQSGRSQDRNAPPQEWELPVGSLKIADLGYFSLRVLSNLGQRGVFFLSRIQIGTKIALSEEFMDLVTLSTLLKQRSLPVTDLPARLGVREKLPVRLLAVRVPKEIAQKRRRKLRQEAKREGETVSQARLELADWNLFVTNVPQETLTLEEALVLMRARWQIEMLFKLWKQHGQIDESRSRNPWRILCEVYAKLIAQLVQQWLFLLTLWKFPDKSLVKASQMINRLAWALAAAFTNRNALEEFLRVIGNCMEEGCRMNTRKNKPNTYQLLNNPTLSFSLA